MERTRIIRLRVEKFNKRIDNHRTVNITRAELDGHLPYRTLFVHHYEDIRAVCQQTQRPGLAMVVVGDGGLAASGWVAAKADSANTAIIGRHGLADLYLPSDPSISLRHLLLILYPLGEAQRTRFRVMDLRTQTAFAGEDDQPLEAIEADGPVFVRCGHYTLFFFPTGATQVWPDTAEAAWEAIPERVYLAERNADPEQWARDARGEMSQEYQSLPDDSLTSVQTLPGASVIEDGLMAADEEVRGILSVESRTGAFRMELGRTALARGVLLGRYRRCDNGRVDLFEILDNPRISRVHLALIEIGGEVYAMDTASTNGVTVDGNPVRLTPLAVNNSVHLCGERVHLVWSGL